MITNLNVNRNDLSFAKLVKDNKFFILPNMYIPFFKLHYQNQTYISANISSFLTEKNKTN